MILVFFPPKRIIPENNSGMIQELYNLDIRPEATKQSMSKISLAPACEAKNPEKKTEKLCSFLG